jgi:GNAT superfamily N-acetyltransferase
MQAESIRVAEEYWAAELGCERAQLRPRAPRVQAHAGRLADDAGAFIIVLDAEPGVSVPSAIVGEVAARAQQIRTQSVSTFEVVSRLLAPARATRLIGPALLKYVDRSTFVAASVVDARELTLEDESALLDMQAACPADELEPKDFAFDAGPMFGAFAADGRLASVSNIRNWSDRIAHISVLTRPSFRGQGFGPRAVSVAASRAFDLGLLPQYRVLSNNKASRRVARKLGFRSYGWTVAVRLVQP